MIKLKYLFDNKDLAQMILENWDYDREDPDLLKYYRISSNAVYWCMNKGERFFLRFTPAEEKSKEKILGELEFLRYLRNNNFNAVGTILSKAGNEIETVNTPWGTYHAVAFKAAIGKRLDRITLTDDIILDWGKELGKLHRLSSQYEPLSYRRSDWKETLNWMEEVLLDFPDETLAKKELNLLREYLQKLPCSKENYGLIHYDFEFDNVFYDENSKTYSSIDYDDGMYHWYALDIEQSIDSMKEELEEDRIQSSVDLFISGYRTEFNISDEMLKLMPVFRRYANLYGYVRLLRSIEEKWNNEPEWLVDLRARLNNALTQRKIRFGESI